SYFAAWYVHKDNSLGRACKLHTLKSMHDFFAALLLARQSMHSQAANALRLACETGWQNTWLHEGENRAHDWEREAGPKKTNIVKQQLSTFKDPRYKTYDARCKLA